MKIIDNVSDLRGLVKGARGGGLRVVLVPTMGALHEGHMALVERAKEEGELVIVSIFVNPTQFGPGEDLEKYPREKERDQKLLTEAGVGALFMPPLEEVYPEGFQTSITLSDIASPERGLCGASRPGHFSGVATVVAKLLNMVQPHKALFGEKDYQQLKVIEALVRDLNMDVVVVPVKTVREEDGLAKSSRNQYLTEIERKCAGVIPRGLRRGVELAGGGERRASRIVEEVNKIVEGEELCVLEYLSIVDGKTLKEIEEINEGARIMIAARVGTTRLIDNMELKV